jgi:hypothetical protein
MSSTDACVLALLGISLPLLFFFFYPSLPLNISSCRRAFVRLTCACVNVYALLLLLLRLLLRYTSYSLHNRGVDMSTQKKKAGFLLKPAFIRSFVLCAFVLLSQFFVIVSSPLFIITAIKHRHISTYAPSNIGQRHTWRNQKRKKKE